MSSDENARAMPDPKGQSITVDYDLVRPPEKVWRALTEPALLATWLMENDIRPVVGHRFKFRAAPTPGWDGVVHCEVLTVEVNRRISYSWRSGMQEEDDHPGRLDTLVTWTLSPTPEGGTRLRLEHTGFLPTNAYAWKGAEWGWRSKFLPKLAETVATAVDPSDTRGQ
jgi:uncharacterized protein YndB with AHSA1/START domain